MTYSDFLARKAIRATASGIPVPPKLSPLLKDHQRLLTRWALRRGRAAIFADTGLGKSLCELEWSRVAADKTQLPALILAPLAVSHQFVREGEKFGIPVTPCADQSDVRPGVNVTNYQKLHKFDPQAFGAVALDEASILKSLDGKTRAMLIEAFSKTPFRLAATATPSPNDHTELGGQAEFLGIMRHQEMLATWFCHDGGSTQDWRLKGHARDAFWSWCCSWSAIVKMPSDIGCDDTGYLLPPLNYHEHIIPATREDAMKSGMLFAAEAETLNEQRAARRGSLESRVAIAVKIYGASWETAANTITNTTCVGTTQIIATRPAASVDSSALDATPRSVSLRTIQSDLNEPPLTSGNDERCVFWCGLNAEQEAVARALGDRCVSIDGSTSDDEKIALYDRWVRGEVPFLVSKVSIFGFGINMQFCHRVIFVGVSHSFEHFYQAVRRCWRFGQDHAVDVHVVSSELEGAVVANLKAKMAKAEEFSSETRRYASAYVRGAVLGAARDTLGYEPHVEMRVPEWMK